MEDWIGWELECQELMIALMTPERPHEAAAELATLLAELDDPHGDGEPGSTG